MKHNVFNQFIFLVVVCLFGVLTYSYYVNGRYQICMSKDGFAIELDTKTGKTWQIVVNRKIKHHDFINAQIKVIPKEELKKITAFGNFSEYGSFLAQVYNSTSYRLQKLHIILSQYSRNDEKNEKRIRVFVKKFGGVGTIPEEKYDANLFEKFSEENLLQKFPAAQNKKYELELSPDSTGLPFRNSKFTCPIKQNGVKEIWKWEIISAFGVKID